MKQKNILKEVINAQVSLLQGDVQKTLSILTELRIQIEESEEN